MRRAPIVVAGTLAGLAGVLGFHTAPAKLTLGAVGATTAGASSPTTSAPPTTTSPPPTTTSRSQQSNAPTTTTTTRTTTTTVAPTTTTTASPTAARTATGPLVNYNFGVLSVKVTVVGTKITNVTIGSIQDGGNYRSQSIDQQSIPILEQETLAAQSGNIQGVSGASYTSAGFQMSLQHALTSLGFK